MRVGADIFRRAVVAAGAAALSVPCAAAAPASENAVKAAFLPRFARYVTWPPATRPAGGGAYVLCVIGDDPFGASLDQAARSQSIDGHRLIVRRLATANGAGQCDVAFIGGARAGQTLAALGRRPVLTVTDARNSSQRGIIHFSVVSGRVRFLINEAEAAARGMTISSRLLALAVGVNQR